MENQENTTTGLLKKQEKSKDQKKNSSQVENNENITTNHKQNRQHFT